MGHMKAVRQGTRSTTKTQKDKQQNNNNDGNNFELEPPRPYLELAQGHQLA